MQNHTAKSLKTNHSSQVSRWRLIIDGPQEGPWNMCVDEALLNAGAQPTIRFYSWLKPTISYGYFQKHVAFEGVPRSWSRVRRLTGGKAIAHHHEITYSFTGPADHFLLSDTVALYKKVHKAWQKALNDIGIKVLFRKEATEDAKNIWCFKKNSCLDLVLPDQTKLMGSAQRRKAGRVLLHGSLPLKQQDIMGGTSLETCLGRSVDWKEILDLLLPQFFDSLNIKVEKNVLTSRESELAQKIKFLRYKSPQWIEKRITCSDIENLV